jgi:hypothetical protein
MCLDAFVEGRGKRKSTDQHMGIREEFVEYPNRFHLSLHRDVFCGNEMGSCSKRLGGTTGHNWNVSIHGSGSAVGGAGVVQL